MIIYGLMQLVRVILSALLIFSIPPLPDVIHETMLSCAQYFGDGVSILRAFIGSAPLTVMATLLSIIIAISSALFLYNTIMWILEKIPMLGIKR